MSKQRLKYLSKVSLDRLYSEILTNVQIYRSAEFSELTEGPGWNIELSIEVDLEPLAGLDTTGNAEAEVENSLRVWRSLYNLTPALACEDRIWSRLCHVECMSYSRERWLNQDDDDTKIAKDVRTHFFAPNLTACRDDNSIARLWWNAKIAKDIRPNNQRGALKLILKTADIRSNFVERSWTVSRPRVADGILRLMEREDWITAKESNYRDFMKSVNHLGGGIVFEMFSDAQIDEFMNNCCTITRK